MTPTRPAKAGHKAFGAVQFILLVLACLVASPFLIAMFIIGFIWKVVDEL